MSLKCNTRLIYVVVTRFLKMHEMIENRCKVHGQNHDH